MTGIGRPDQRLAGTSRLVAVPGTAGPGQGAVRQPGRTGSAGRLDVQRPGQFGAFPGGGLTMSAARPTVESVTTIDPATTERVTAVRVPEPLSPAIVRPRPHVEAVLAQSLRETGPHGRTALAWAWALTGTRPSPVTLGLAPGCPPSRPEILAEAAAQIEGSTAPRGVPADFRDQLRQTRGVLAWLAGGSDLIPVDTDNRGRFIGARGDYARTDAEIREARGHAIRGLSARDLPEPLSAADARHPWRWDPAWMQAARLRGVRDLLGWVLGDCPAAPLCQRSGGRPSTYELTHEDAAANDVVMQGRSGGRPVDPDRYPPPQYGEGVQAAIRWLRGEATTPPASADGANPYARRKSISTT